MSNLKENILKIIEYYFNLEKQQRNNQKINSREPYQGIDLQQIFAESELYSKYSIKEFEQAIQALLQEHKIKTTVQNPIDKRYILSE